MLTNTIDLNELFPDPDEVGTSEYRTLLDYLNGLDIDVEGGPIFLGDDDDDMSEASVGTAEDILEYLVCLEEEVSSRCASLRQAIKEARRRS